MKFFVINSIKVTRNSIKTAKLDEEKIMYLNTKLLESAMHTLHPLRHGLLPSWRWQIPCQIFTTQSPSRKNSPGKFPIPLPLNAIWKTLDKRPSLLKFVCLFQVKFDFPTKNIFFRVVSWHQKYIIYKVNCNQKLWFVIIYMKLSRFILS